MEDKHKIEKSPILGIKGEEMARDKVKIKNIKKPDFKGKASSLAFALLALVLTIIVFAGLLFVKDLVSDEIIYQSVVVAKQDIPENEIITEANAPTYFTLKDVNTLDTTTGYLTNVDNIIGTQAKVSLLQGEIVSQKDFKNVASYTENISDPIEISIDVGAIANADGGKIRSGDVVNIAMMFNREQLGLAETLDTVSQINGSGSLLSIPDLNLDQNSDSDGDLTDFFDDVDSSEDSFFEDSMSDSTDPINLTEADLSSASDDYNFEYYANYVLENVYVVKALDSSGAEISPTDSSSASNILVFVIDKSQESAVNNALANCSNIRVSKVVNNELDTERAIQAANEEAVAEEKSLAEQMADEVTTDEE